MKQLNSHWKVLYLFLNVERVIELCKKKNVSLESPVSRQIKKRIEMFVYSYVFVIYTFTLNQRTHERYRSVLGMYQSALM